MHVFRHLLLVLKKNMLIFRSLF